MYLHPLRAKGSFFFFFGHCIATMDEKPCVPGLWVMRQRFVLHTASYFQNVIKKWLISKQHLWLEAFLDNRNSSISRRRDHLKLKSLTTSDSFLCLVIPPAVSGSVLEGTLCWSSDVYTWVDGKSVKQRGSAEGHDLVSHVGCSFWTFAFTHTACIPFQALWWCI